MDSEQTTTFKILILGETGVGKTFILRRFVENKFLKNHLSTTGLEFRTKTVNVKNKEIKLKIWATAGPPHITEQYYRGADGIVLVYDVTDEPSYDKVKKWIDDIISNTGRDSIGLVLLGNKCDFEERAVTEEQGKKLGEEFKISYFETSPLTGQGIKEAFDQLTKDIMKIRDVDNGKNTSIELKKGKIKKEKSDFC